MTVLISLAKKITPKLKNLILEEITKDETISLQLFLSFIVIKVLEAKGLIKKSMRIFEDDVKNPSLLSKYLYLIQILHNNFNNFDAIFSIIHKITEKNLKNIVFLFKETSDENWNNEEIISWCYEYYNYPSEKKAVDNSQFYTPAWIVEFLIEHTLTKNFVDKNNISIEKIRIIDPACGCGNFIIQIYDALKNIYLSKGYEPKEASKMIITHNLYGVDIDEIAVEITNLILKIKAMEDGVLKIRETNFVSIPKLKSGHPLFKKLEVMGSLITQSDLKILKKMNIQDNYLSKLIKILTQKYDIVLTNPPYLDSSDYKDDLKKYINEDYRDFRKNLYSCFIKKNYELLKDNGYIGMITPQTFMFISSYEQTRKFIINNMNIEKLVHFGLGGVFDSALVDTAMYVLKKSKKNNPGEYIQLTSFNGKDEKKKILDAIWKDQNQDLMNRYVYKVDKTIFSKVPRSPFIYWIKQDIIDIFENACLESCADVRQGIATGNNKKFLRYFWEVRKEDISFNHKKDGKKWVPYTKGGPYNKWFGNLWWVIAFDEENYNILKNMGNNLPNRKYYFKRGITYTMTTSKGATFRYLPENFLFDCKGSSIFFHEDKYIFRFLGLLNSAFFSYLEKFVAGSVDLEVGDLKKLPVPTNIFIDSENIKYLELLSKVNIAIKKHNTQIYPTELHFDETLFYEPSKFHLYLHTKNALDTYLLLSNGLIDIIVFDLYNLSPDSINEVYQSEGIPSAFFACEKKVFDKLPPLASLLDEKDINELLLTKEDLNSVEFFIKKFYKNNVHRFEVISCEKKALPEEYYNNYVESLSKKTLQNPALIFNHMKIAASELKQMACLKIDNDIKNYLLESEEGFISYGFSNKNEEILLSKIFKDRFLLEDTINTDLKTFIRKDYFTFHNKLYKNRPIVWKLGNNNFGFLIHYHNINEKTKKNILSFLKKQNDKSKEMTTFTKKIHLIEFNIRIDDGILINKEIFYNIF